MRDYVYIAGRKIELADVKARTEEDRERIAAAEKQGVVIRDIQVKSTQLALANSREQLKDERTANQAATSELVAANTAQGKELEQTAAQLDAEKQARLTAEGKLAGAMKDLATVAAVKEETRGVVITLSGSVLFATNRYELLETAKTKLDQVAEALKDQDAGKIMVVEGHTDNRGSDATNQPLSLNRATAVQNYLVSRGVDSAKISAVGMGSSHPLVDNSNAENRANNRRVEIVIQNSRVTER
jgi:outer membrane protein OmpA-like peptidoglycan-associated protein